MDTVKFIAPNGARVIVNNWKSKVLDNDHRKRWQTEVMMQIIFNDPVITK